MATATDLSNLKELLKLYKSLNIANSETREKYNSLVEWAISKYWKIGISVVVNLNTSIDRYYNVKQCKSFDLNINKYLFMPMCFGTVYIYSNGSMMELGSGNVYQLNKVFKDKCDKILNEFEIEFLRFVLYKNIWILEDAILQYASVIDVFNFAKNIGIETVPYLFLNVTKTTIFNNSDYNAIENILKDINSKYYIVSLCYIINNTLKRNIIDFYKTGYVFIESIDVEHINDNKYIPQLTTKSGEIILIKDIEHLISCKVKSKSFITVKRKQSFSILCNNGGTSTETRAEALYRIIKEIGNEYFVNGKYLSKVNNIGIKQLANKLDIKEECKTLSDLVKVINTCSTVKDKLKSISPFDLTRICLEYPENDFITLVNNMHFHIENSKVLSFKLENINCLNNPSIETIYSSFNQFVVLFNILVDAKKQ
ncbi:DNA polymerase processivity factor [Eptesipox virus]|uniref:DNA polymerase processivity factor n=1 Tax=Eptesipox virus TaxID=1329402 RepID=A0A220T6H9_9POXV|nr:DNA polymerase processivity factor [Eptesipox virus]ASK51319.1 DNA polymerase processivity factor [Eptesipox virus]WAH71077.1 DNA polymerase processivity factor [Eptesipox virus]